MAPPSAGEMQKFASRRALAHAGKAKPDIKCIVTPTKQFATKPEVSNDNNSMSVSRKKYGFC